MTNITEPQDEKEAFPTRDQIERCAYEIYLKRGGDGQDGCATEDWLAAETQLKLERAVPPFR